MLTWNENKPLSITAVVLGVVLVIFVAAQTRNVVKQNYYIGKSTEVPRTITISGTGKQTVVPDVATIDLGYQVEKSTVAAAQADLTKKMNALIDAVKKLNIDKKDIKTTNYSVYPQYDWTNNRQTFRGFSATQNVQVKIRDFDNISPALQLIGDLGLNQVGGLNFTIDDPEAIRTAVREKALADAKTKAEALAKIMGVRLGKVISFSESSGGVPPMPIFYDRGIAASETKAAAPSVEAGSQDVQIDATVTYELN